MVRYFEEIEDRENSFCECAACHCPVKYHPHNENGYYFDINGKYVHEDCIDHLYNRQLALDYIGESETDAVEWYINLEFNCSVDAGKVSESLLYLCKKAFEDKLFKALVDKEYGNKTPLTLIDDDIKKYIYEYKEQWLDWLYDKTRFR